VTEEKKAFAFFPGCLIPVKYPQMELAIRKTLPGLGIDIVDLQGFTCCPDPIYFKATDKTAWLTIAARNLTIAEEAGLDIFTICSGCTATLSEATHLLAEDEALCDKINDRLQRVGRRYNGTTRVRHIVTLLRDKIGLDKVAATVTRPLEGIKIATHYGCHLLKPSNIMEVDDPDFPHLMDDLITGLGAIPVSHTERLLCCGKACNDQEIPPAMMTALLRSAKEVEADILGVICPSCFGEFDPGQLRVSAMAGEDLKTPAVYYFQLLGLAQGLSAQEVGLHRHRVKPTILLERFSEAA
jgi:heterodisulfide reductase subunit B